MYRQRHGQLRGRKAKPSREGGRTLRLVDGARQYTAKLPISAKARNTAGTAKVTATFARNASLLGSTLKEATARLT
jgi:hypothetical protein